jgi:hypothetical protein
MSELVPKVEPGFFDRTQTANLYGVSTSADVPYFVFDAGDEDTAIAAVHGASDTWLLGMLKESINIEERLNETTFKVIVSYKKPDWENNDDVPLKTKRVSVSSNLYQENTGKNKDGADIYVVGIDGKKDYPQGGVPAFMPQKTIQITYEAEAAPSDALIDTYLGKINSQVWRGGNAGTWMCTQYSYSENELGRFDVTISCQYKANGWLPVLYYVCDSEDEANGKGSSGTIGQDGSGNPYTSVPQLYESADFTGLDV